VGNINNDRKAGFRERHCLFRLGAFLLRQGSSLDQAMNQPVSGSPVVTHHLGALIALGTLLAINLAWMSKFFFGWW
jgi:hypothetical protein